MCTRTQGAGGGRGIRSQWQYLKCPYADPGQNWRNWEQLMSAHLKTDKSQGTGSPEIAAAVPC